MPSIIMTEEQRAEGQAKAKAGREAAKALPLKREWLDDEAWQQLAQSQNVRLPNWVYPPEPASMRTWLRRMKVKEREYLDAVGVGTLAAWVERNPTWPLRAWVGLLLEYVDQRDSARGSLNREAQ